MHWFYGGNFLEKETTTTYSSRYDHLGFRFSILLYIANSLFAFSDFRFYLFCLCIDVCNIYMQTFCSALATAIFLFIISVVIIATRFTPSNTTSDFLVRHSIYETLYVALIISLPSGFVVFFFQNRQTWGLGANGVQAHVNLNKATYTGTLTA